MLADLREHFDALEVSRAALLNRLTGVDPTQWAQAPRAGSWSLSEIAQHLVLAEEEVLRQLRNPEAGFARRQTLRDFLGRTLVGWIFRRGIPVKTPMHTLVPAPGRPLEEIRHNWERLRSELASYLATLQEGDRNRIVFLHPVAGRTTIVQTLELIRMHFENHVRQATQVLHDAQGAGDEAMSQQHQLARDKPKDGGASAVSKLDTPGVRFPPPLVYLATTLVGVAIDRAVPVRIFPNTVAGWLGGAFVLLGLTIGGISLREFRKAKTTIHPNRPASALVAAGPFRYSRNPMYLALSILQVGIGVWMNTVWVVLLLVPTLVWIRRSVIAREERHLTQKFGQAYLDYQAKVRRWL